MRRLELAKRKHPSREQKERLLTKNLYRCCVCKRGGIGLHLHHIDEDSSNTVDENLAVLCVQDHDLHHRPDAYDRVKHTELGAERIKEFKSSWERFVTEARQDQPKILATVSVYGNYEHIHAAQLVMQWFDEKIEYERVFHLLEGDYEYWAEEIIGEVDYFGKNIKVVIINEPLPVEYCPCCGKGFSRTVKEGNAALFLRFSPRRSLTFPQQAIPAAGCANALLLTIISLGQNFKAIAVLRSI